MKTAIRKQMLDLRKKLSNDDVTQKSNKIFDYLIKQEMFLNAKTVMIYLSCNNEVDTSNIINFCLEKEKTVCVPKIVSKGIMLAYKIENLDFDKNFIKNKYGIYEPKSTIEVLPADIDCAIVPMVGADILHNRLGYGGGYYDRFLSKTNAYKIGLCYNFQLFKAELTTEKTDIKMDMIITDSNVY